MFRDMTPAVVAGLLVVGSSSSAFAKAPGATPPETSLTQLAKELIAAAEPSEANGSKPGDEGAHPPGDCRDIVSKIFEGLSDYAKELKSGDRNKAMQIASSLKSTTVSLVHLDSNSCTEKAESAYVLGSIALLDSDVGLYNCGYESLAHKALNLYKTGGLGILTPVLRKQWGGAYEKSNGRDYFVQAAYSRGEKIVFIDPMLSPLDLAAAFLVVVPRTSTEAQTIATHRESFLKTYSDRLTASTTDPADQLSLIHKFYFEPGSTKKETSVADLITLTPTTSPFAPTASLCLPNDQSVTQESRLNPPVIEFEGTNTKGTTVAGEAS